MKTLYIFAALLFASSCIVDEHRLGPASGTPVESSGGVGEVSFLAEMPVPCPVSTRAAGSARENAVEDIHILVFEPSGPSGDGALIYKGSGRALTVAPDASSDNKITFRATLPVGVKCDFVVLANAAADLAALSVGSGATKADVLALTRTLASKWPAAPATATDPASLDPIPMWGELRGLKLETGSSVAFPLVRMLARVGVEYASAEPDPAAPDPAPAPDNFRLSSVRVYNHSTCGTLVPAAAALASDGTTVTVPTAPAAGYGTAETALVYTDIEDDKRCAEQIYLFEAPHNGSTYGSATDAWIDNPCLVVGGRWSADGVNWPAAETYYRIDFIHNGDWLPLLRNFSYNVAITAVGGEGYRDPETALRSAPFNLTANVLPWNESGMERVIFDGAYYLSVNRDEFTLPRAGSQTLLADGSNGVKIKTDYIVGGNAGRALDADSGWHVERIDYTSGTGTGWLALSPALRPGDWQPGDTDRAHFSFTDNPGPDNRTATVWIRAGRLEYPIRVTQKILSLDILDSAPSTTAGAIEEMVFDIRATGIGNVPAPRDFWAAWTPAVRPVAISATIPRPGFAFETGWLSPDPDAAQHWTIPGTVNATGPGAQRYTVAPPAVTDTDLSRDDLYERETVYRFEVENDGERVHKDIHLRHVYYNLVVDTYAYRLDGATYTMTARSNAPWVITAIEEWVYNEPPGTHPGLQLLDLRPYDNLQIGSTGGPHRLGESVAFTTWNDTERRTLYGTVYVTFESPDGKFPPVIAPLVFAPESIPILTIGHTELNRAFNPGKSSTYHSYSAFDMFANFRNFGNLDRSVVKTSPLEFHPHNWTAWSNAPTNTADDNFRARLGDLKRWINLYRPSIIMVAYATQLNTAESRLLVEYMTNGGVVILYYGCSLQEEIVVNRFFNVLFNRTWNTTGGNDELRYEAETSGQIVTLEDIDHPILNGPFGDLRGRGFGFHEQRMSMKRSLVSDQVISLANTETAQARDHEENGGTDGTYAWVHRTLPLLWVGNGYGFSTYFNEIAAEYYHDPLKVDNATLAPAVNTDYAIYTRTETNHHHTDVYNAHFACNALAWALGRTSYRHPSDDYASFGPGTYMQ